MSMNLKIILLIDSETSNEFWLNLGTHRLFSTLFVLFYCFKNFKLSKIQYLKNDIIFKDWNKFLNGKLFLFLISSNLHNKS